MSGLTHFDQDGRPVMVDVSGKTVTARMAKARGRVLFSKTAYEELRASGVKKGDIRLIAELAGIQGVKRTAELIPLCHPLPITSVKVDVDFDDAATALTVRAQVKTTGQTGVEMEALSAVSIACLTIYDMAKAIDKSMIIEGICLEAKTGGKSGDFNR